MSEAFGGGFPNGISFRPAISDDGQVIAFVSRASDLLAPGEDTNDDQDVFVYDRVADTIERVSVFSNGDEAPTPGLGASGLTITGDGRFVAFQSDEGFDPTDTNGVTDVYVRDRAARDDRAGERRVRRRRRGRGVLRERHLGRRALRRLHEL